VPVSERERPSDKTYTMFAQCVYPPACLGAPNIELKNQYFESVNNRTDLALVGFPYTKTTNTTCAAHLAFRKQSRLCHTCNITSRRQGVGKCETCPDRGLTIFLMILGCLITLAVIIFLVASAISDAGKIKLSESIQKITLNYLQVIAFAQKFPLRWPRVLVDLFEFQGAISTVGEHLLSPDCLSTTTSPAELFYSKQIMFAVSPFIVISCSFLFWFVYGCCSGNRFFTKRARDDQTTTKDKFVLTICTVLYLLFPTLCTQAFEMFHCRYVAGEFYLAADMEEVCYKERHAQWMALGIAQLLLYVIGLPILVLLFLRRNKHMEGGGLKKHATIVRYGLFYGAYKEGSYYWEIILTTRKIAVVALSVFGPGIGTERQVQAVLAVLLICISFEIAGDPFYLVEQRFRILSRLELSTLFVQWATMWCGAMIFASQDPGSEGFVVFLTVVVATINIGMLVWLVVSLLMECVREQREEKAEKKRKAAAMLLVDWETCTDEETGHQFRYNKKTGETKWVVPEDPESNEGEAMNEHEHETETETENETTIEMVAMSSSSSSSSSSSNSGETKSVVDVKKVFDALTKWETLLDEETGSLYMSNSVTGETKWVTPEEDEVDGEEENEEGGVIATVNQNPLFMKQRGKKNWKKLRTAVSVANAFAKGKGGGGGGEWEKHVDAETGYSYWYNRVTGATEWLEEVASS
jgi:hypothetical protein